MFWRDGAECAELRLCVEQDERFRLCPLLYGECRYCMGNWPYFVTIDVRGSQCVGVAGHSPRVEVASPTWDAEWSGVDVGWSAVDVGWSAVDVGWSGVDVGWSGVDARCPSVD